MRARLDFNGFKVEIKFVLTFRLDNFRSIYIDLINYDSL